MAALVPIYQKSFDVYGGRKVTVTQVKIASTSDTFTLESGVTTSNSVSTKQLRKRNETQVTAVVHVNSTGVVTLSSAASQIGNIVTVVSLHEAKNSSVIG